MNARQLKAAFFYKSTVFSDDKNNSIPLGYISRVIYYLSDSGKRHAKGEIQPWDKNKTAAVVPCRKVHFVSNEPKKELPVNELNEHTEKIKNAFLNVLPVVAVVPTVGTVVGHIKEIVYWRTKKGNIQCSAVILDTNCPGCTVQVRLKYIMTKEEYEKENGC